MMNHSRNQWISLPPDKMSRNMKPVSAHQLVVALLKLDSIRAKNGIEENHTRASLSVSAHHTDQHRG